MTPEQAKSLFDFLYPWAKQEAQTTRKVLAAVPSGNLEYCPDPKGMKGIELAAHIATADLMFVEGILNGEFSMGQPPELKTPEAVLKFYDEQFLPALNKLATLTPEQLAKSVNFFVFDHPAVTFLQWLIVHGVHHRGQLSAYLRPMGGKVPSIYGGSADEPFKAPEQAAAGQ